MTDQTTEENGKTGNRRSLLLALIPLAVFLALAGIFYKQLAAGGATSELPSALIGREAPTIELDPLEGLIVGGNQIPGFTSDMFAGKISLVNIWASWCAPCRQEHPLLVELGKDDRLQIIGLNYKDKTANALRFLGQLGNPYDVVGIDPKGRGAIEWGVYGVPETYVVSPDGVILHKHVGPLSPAGIRETILPLIDEYARNPASSS